MRQTPDGRRGEALGARTPRHAAQGQYLLFLPNQIHTDSPLTSRCECQRSAILYKNPSGSKSSHSPKKDMIRVLYSASCALWSLHALQHMNRQPDDFYFGGYSGPSWFQQNWEPSIRCLDNVRVGPHGDGGKWLCDPECFLKPGECTVWSLGSNNEFGFETAMAPYGCEVHTFDHTVENPTPPEGVHFWPLGAAAVDGDFLKSLRTLYKDTNATGAIDVLKIDCEGCEYEVFTDPDTLEFIKSTVKQIMVEVHFNGVKSTESLAQAFADAGFKTFSKEPNIQFSDGSCVEYAMINTLLVKIEHD